VVHLHVVLGVVSGWLIAAAGSVNSISGLGSDLQSVITAAGTALAVIALGGGGLALAYHALARNFDADPARVAHHNASMRKVLVGTAIAVSSGGLVAAVAHFF
jgi:hypothetical protein